MRKRKARQTLYNTLQNLHLLQRQPLPEDTYLQTESHDQLWSAVSQLDEKHRLPVILRYAHGLPAAEIAQILDLSEGTVHSRLHYARKKLLGDLKNSQRLTALQGVRKEQPAGGLP
jgi:RNA polymerase sigma factor (sigma-70 family)